MLGLVSIIISIAKVAYHIPYIYNQYTYHLDYDINPKATDRGPLGPRTRLTTDYFCVSYL